MEKARKWDAPIKATLLQVAVVLCLFFLLACTSPSNSPNISNPGYNFNALWRGGSSTSSPLEVPLPPANLTASVSGGVVTLSWQIPQIYESSTLNIGYRIFRQVAPNPGGVTWNFTTGGGADWGFDTKTPVSASSSACTPAGVCSFTDNVGGPVLVSYAIIAFWDINNEQSNHSVDVDISTTTQETAVNFTYPVGFMNGLPSYTVGSAVAAVDQTPQVAIYNYASTAAPWFLMDASQSQATAASWAPHADPITVGLSSDSLTALLPDAGYSRGIYLTRGSMALCDTFSAAFTPLCYSTLLSTPLTPSYAFGQQSDDVSKSFDANPLPTSRKFTSRSTSIQKGASGTTYLFIADQQRILIRSGDIYSCAGDPGEGGDAATGLGPDGLCGFQWSIGTYSPRQRCPWHADGTQVTGGSDCTDAEVASSMADANSPTNYSLRMPGAPIIVGANLYIPDTGNARLVRLANFETAIKTCGQLLPAGSTATNGFCQFDQVVGQYGSSPTDPAIFTTRSCIRGGEEGGYLGTTALSANAPFTDPTGGSGSGGAACQLDTLTNTTVSPSIVQRNRMAGDFMDETDSMMSPDTGLLADITQGLFRAPVQIKYDSTSGFLYVMDSGITIAESAASSNVAMLPPRIMVWQKDPFSFQACVPTDPTAATPSCSIDQNGNCKGTGCVDRQCNQSECYATYFFGQNAALYGFPYQSGQTLQQLNPQGYYPLTAFDVGWNGGQYGLWAVGGQDGRVFHWNTISQTAVPDIHNQASSSNVLTYTLLNFSGINVDSNTGEIILWDTTENIGVAWLGVATAVSNSSTSSSSSSSGSSTSGSASGS